MRILYWNIYQNVTNLFDEIKMLSQQADILILAELCNSKQASQTTNYIQQIQNETRMLYVSSNGKVEDAWLHVFFRKNIGFDISFISKYDALKVLSDLSDLSVATDSEYFARYLNRFERMLFFEVKTSDYKFLLVPLHFPSRMYCSPRKQKDLGVQFKSVIQKVEDKKNLRSLVIGDFNMNPFEEGMIHHESFFALPAQEQCGTQEFYQIPYHSFYNPCWAKLGDFVIDNGLSSRKPAGSYFNEKSSDLNYFWYLFDQVIIRKELIEKFELSSLQYLTGYDKKDQLINLDYSPNKKYSDHLPLLFKLTL